MRNQSRTEHFDMNHLVESQESDGKNREGLLSKTEASTVAK